MGRRKHVVIEGGNIDNSPTPTFSFTSGIFRLLLLSHDIREQQLTPHTFVSTTFIVQGSGIQLFLKSKFIAQINIILNISQRQ